MIVSSTGHLRRSQDEYRERRRGNFRRNFFWYSHSGGRGCLFQIFRYFCQPCRFHMCFCVRARVSLCVCTTQELVSTDSRIKPHPIKGLQRRFLDHQSTPLSEFLLSSLSLSLVLLLSLSLSLLLSLWLAATVKTRSAARGGMSGDGKNKDFLTPHTKETRGREGQISLSLLSIFNRVSTFSWPFSSCCLDRKKGKRRGQFLIFFFPLYLSWERGFHVIKFSPNSSQVSH